MNVGAPAPTKAPMVDAPLTTPVAKEFVIDVVLLPSVKLFPIKLPAFELLAPLNATVEFENELMIRIVETLCETSDPKKPPRSLRLL